MLYALDFDGVVIDSMNECLNTSYSALIHLKMSSGQRLPAKPSSEEISHFHLNRGLVRPSRNYYALWEWIREYPEQEFSLSEFELFANGFGEALSEFENIFHDFRSDELRQSPKTFVEKNPLYVGVKDIWKDLPRPLFIVSTKDQESISLILDSHNLSVDGIYGRGSGPKAQTIRRLAKLHDVKLQDSYFLDDNSQHAIEVQSIGTKSALATWGYGPFDEFDGPKLKSFVEVLEFFQPMREVENS
jgi:phosphoglycolate phosphatase-like HAD superfamily hydrolase